MLHNPWPEVLCLEAVSETDCCQDMLGEQVAGMPFPFSKSGWMKSLAGKLSPWSLLWQERLPGSCWDSHHKLTHWNPESLCKFQSRMLLLTELYPCQLQADESWQAGICLVASCRDP